MGRSTTFAASFSWPFLGAAALGLGACNTSGSGMEDLSLADLAGADLTGTPPQDFSGPVTITPTSAVTIIVEPGDNGDMMVAAINGVATSAFHMTMYQLTSSRVINAHKARKTAGVEVKVLLNHDFPGGMGSNASVYSELMGAGVSVRYAPSTAFQYTHEKAMVIDGKTAWIMTMNASDSAMSGNREFSRGRHRCRRHRGDRGHLRSRLRRRQRDHAERQARRARR